MDREKTQSFDIKDIFAVIRRRKWLVVVPWILASLTVFVGSYFLTPVYQSFAIVLMDRDVRLTGDLQSLMGMGRSYQADDRRSEELKGYLNELTSSAYISKLVEQLKLDQNPDVIKAAEKAVKSAPSLTLDQAKLYILQSQIESRISLNWVGADQIQILAESSTPAQARDIANVLSELFVAERLRSDVASARSSQDFSDVQLQKYDRQLQQKIADKTRFEKSMLANQLDSSVISEGNRGQIQLEIDQTAQDISDYQNEERRLLGDISAAGISTADMVLKESQQNQDDKEALKTQLRSLGDMATKYRWADPQLLNMRLRINSLLASINEENKRLVNSQFASQKEDIRAKLARLFTVRANLDFYVTKNDYIKASLDEVKDRMSRGPEYQATLDSLNREIASATELRDRFKRQQEGSTISQALLQDVATTRYRIVEPAKLPLKPVKPDHVKIVLLGILLGLAIGSAAAILAEIFDSSFKKVQEVEDTLGLPVLGIVPKIDYMNRVV